MTLKATINFCQYCGSSDIEHFCHTLPDYSASCKSCGAHLFNNNPNLEKITFDGWYLSPIDLKVICIRCSWSGLASLSSFREIIHFGLDGDDSYRSISIFCPSCQKEELVAEYEESIE